MKKFLSFIAVLICISIITVHAQCPNYCNPNSGSAYLSHTPQCYGDGYEITITGEYEWAEYYLNGIYQGAWSYYAWNGTFSATPSSSYSFIFHSTCYTSSPSNYCCSGHYDQYGNFYCDQYCVQCNTTSYNTTQTSSVSVGALPTCNISVSATHTDVSDYACSDGTITVTASTNSCNGYYVNLNDGTHYLSSGQSITVGGYAPGDYTITAYSAVGGCEATTNVTISQPTCHVTGTITVANNVSDYNCNNGKLNFTGNASNCLGYYVQLYKDSILSYNPTNSSAGWTGYYYQGDNIYNSFYQDNLPPGNYYAVFTSNDGLCSYATSTVTITQPACHINPGILSVTQQVTDYNCGNGKLALTGVLTSTCTQFYVQLFKDDALYGYMYNDSSGYWYWYYGGYGGDNAHNSLYAENLPPGSYYAVVTNYSGDACNDTTNTVTITQPACHITPGILSVTQQVTNFNCSNGKLALTGVLTSTCTQFYVQLFKDDALYGYMYNDSSGYWYWYYGGYGGDNTHNSLHAENLPPGSYYAVITNYSGDACNDTTNTVIITQPACNISANITTTPAGGYGFGCGNFGSLQLIANVSGCNQLSANLTDPNGYTGGGIYGINNQYWLANGDTGTYSYYLHAGQYEITIYSQTGSCSQTYNVTVGPDCSINGSLVSALNGEITVNATTNDCNGYSAFLTYAATGDPVSNSSAASGTNITFSGLAVGNYNVEFRSATTYYSTPCTQIISVTLLSSMDTDGDGVADGLDCDYLNPAVWQSSTLYIDSDNDGWDGGTQVVCYGSTIPTGFLTTTIGSDCNDNDHFAQVMNMFYVDADGDSYGSNITSYQCSETPPPGYSSNSLDCDDNNVNIFESFPFYQDTDGDGFGDSNGPMLPVCALNANTPPSGYSINNSDCDNGNALFWQSALLYIDNDGDGYDAGSQTICYGAIIPAGYNLISNGTDCNDNSNAINPGSLEICGNGIDDNCNGQVDEGCDMDGDGYTIAQGDCNDNNVNIHPGAIEICNGIDDNCDGSIDNVVFNTTITANGPLSFCTNIIFSIPQNPLNSYQWRKNAVNITGATNSTYTATSTGTYSCKVSQGTCYQFSNNISATKLAVPTVTMSGNANFCSNSTGNLLAATSATATGYQWYLGTNPISGAISNNYSATSAGVYKVIVNNAVGCTASVSKTLTLRAATSTTTPTGTQTSCTGSLTLTANTGASYQWIKDGLNINGATQQTYLATEAGQFQVVNTSTYGCIATSSAVNVLMGVSPTSVITAAGSTSLCSGSSVMLNVNTDPAYTYQWRKNGTNISGATNAIYTANATGTFTCNVTKGACSVLSNGIAVVVNALPTSAISGNGSLCPGETGSTLTASSGVGYSYQWKLGASLISGATNQSYLATSAGSYTVVVTSAQGCSKISSAKSLAFANPSATITATGALTFCNGSSVLFTANTGSGYTWQWRKNGIDISGATAQTFIATESGSYTVQVTKFGAATYCSKISAAKTVVVNSCARLENNQYTEVLTYPNPTDGIINLNFVTNGIEKYQLKILDISGKTIYSDNSTSTEGENLLTYDLSLFTKGVYIIHLTSSSINYYQKLVVQ